MKYILLSLILLVGLPDVTFGQSKWEKFLKKVEKASQEAQKIDKQVQQLKKQAEKSGRKQSTSIPHFKSISKSDFISGKHKKITIPYDHNLSVKYGVAEWEVTRDGKKQYKISSKIYMTADGATYDRWRKRLRL
jgi:hypothetical protein